MTTEPRGSEAVQIGIRLAKRFAYQGKPRPMQQPGQGRGKPDVSGSLVHRTEQLLRSSLRSWWTSS